MGATLTFWGVRGSIPACGAETVRYGGNTSCVSIEHKGCVVILDAGTGIRKLGRHLLERGEPDGIEGHILLTHHHWDHVQGLPFFAPAFLSGNRFVVYGERKKRGLAEIFEDQMQEPHFPVGMSALKAGITFVEVAPGEELELHSDIRVTTHRLNHPNEAIGYVVNVAGARVAYVTDHEHEEGELSPTVLQMAHGVDLLIHDAQYSRKQLADRKGWGHSAWEDVVDLAIQAKVQRLLLFHHDPDASDEELDERLLQVQERLPSAVLAREGLKLPLG